MNAGNETQVNNQAGQAPAEQLSLFAGTASVPDRPEQRNALISAQGIGAQGIDAQGIGAQGIDAQGLGAQGIGAQGLNRYRVNPHLLAARRLARKMRKLPDHSAEQTRAGLAICQQLKAFLRDGVADSDSVTRKPH